MSLHLAKKGYRVILWGAFPEYLKEMRSTRENRKFLPGFKIPSRVRFEPDLKKAVLESQTVFVAVPSRYFRSVVGMLTRQEARKKTFVILSKGIETKSSMLMSEVLEDELGRVPHAVVSGPCISVEIARGIPTAVVVAAHQKKIRSQIRRLLNSPSFTVLETRDEIGVQLGGSVKNVIALAAGILDGLGYGSNTKSVLLARGVAEMVRLGRKLYAKEQTFLGLSGLGDLVTTCFNPHSRNHTCGYELGKGVSLKKILGNTEMVIEGIETAKAAQSLSRRHGIPMPLTRAVHGVLFNKRKPETVIDALMHKRITQEID